MRSTDQHPHFQGCVSSDRAVRWFPVQGWPMSSWRGARPKHLPSVCETPRRCTARRWGTNSSLCSKACSLNREKNIILKDERKSSAKTWCLKPVAEVADPWVLLSIAGAQPPSRRFLGRFNSHNVGPGSADSSNTCTF